MTFSSAPIQIIPVASIGALQKLKKGLSLK